jgi:predicted transcriptional regulator
MAQMAQVQLKPTIVGVGNFDANADATALQNAMKGMGTDEKAIIKILTTRNNSQVQQIRKAFEKLYNKDLMKAIKDETTGKFESACVNLLWTRTEFDAKELHDAISGMGTNEDTIIEILCTRTSSELAAIMKAYEAMYKNTLEKDVKGDTSGDFEKVLVAILQCKRPVNGKIDYDAAKKDAEALYKAGEGKMGTDEKLFIQIFTGRAYNQIGEIAHQYEQLGKKTLNAAIDSEFNGSIQKALQTICMYGKDPAGYWADQLKITMKGMGTDENKLMRIFISRSEIDLRSVRDVFGDRYGKGKTLIDWVKSDLSGDFENIIVGLLLGNDQK